MKDHAQQPGAPRLSLFARFDLWLQQRQRRAIDVWLGTSQNVAELEARMRDLNRSVTFYY